MGKNYRGNGKKPFDRNNRFNRNNHHNDRDKKFNKSRHNAGSSHFKKDNNKEWKVFNNLTEEQIGVTMYIGDIPPFNGIIKARFSDFHVNEIDMDGNEVVFNEMQVPKPPKVEAVNEEESQKLIPADTWKEIILIADGSKNAKAQVEIDVTNIDKPERTLIHTKIKERFGQAIVSTTVERNSKKFITCSKYSKGGIPQRTKWPWPHEYTYFIMHKENVDTINACSMLASNMKCKPSVLTYAGTKDKRGKTSQLICIKKGEPSRISQACKHLQNIFVGNFTFKPETLKLGQLKGNRFQIVLRQIVEQEEIIVKSLTSINEQGFINYYGLQRFGNSATIPTYEIGIAILKQQWKEVCELILKPREGEPSFISDMRKFWWKSRDAKGALNMLHRSNNTVEAKLLEGLAKNGDNDYSNAFSNVPRNMRLLYVHSYQSLIWNQIVSRRIKEKGLVLQEGDLVFADPNTKINTETDLADPGTEMCLDECSPEDEKSAEDKKNEEDEKEKREECSAYKNLVKPLTKEDIESDEYTIFDLVLPLPGHDITYPANEVASWYDELLAVHDLSSEKLKKKSKVYSLTGAYRKMVVKPQKMSWYFQNYSDPNDTIVLSDYEKLRGVLIPESMKKGPLKSLVIDFCLPSSTYATMALREILKVDTSAANQSKLNEAGKVQQTDKDASVAVAAETEIIGETPNELKHSETDDKEMSEEVTGEPDNADETTNKRKLSETDEIAVENSGDKKIKVE